MAIRTTVTAVRLIIDTALTDDQVSQYISDASLWVDEQYEDECDGATAARLEAIERYLAAHLIQRADPSTGNLTSATRANISETYDSSADSEGHLKYAKTAASFDPCGIVAEHWLGAKRARYRVGTTYADDA